MSKEKRLPPIQPEPFRPFTVRLVKGHFVRVPRVGNLAPTDTTRPPTQLPRRTIPYGDGKAVGRNLRLVDGRFVSDADQPAKPTATAVEDGTTSLENIDDRSVEFLDRRAVIPKFQLPH